CSPTAPAPTACATASTAVRWSSSRRPECLRDLLSQRRRIAQTPRPLVDLDEDALAGALLGGLDDGLLEVARDTGEALDAAGIAQYFPAVLDVGEAVVEEREDVGTDLFARSEERRVGKERRERGA